ncbi:MAG: phage portal protein [Schaedlerella sp.]|nr:phage portal protein [Lachnospiraceae bacterium]MDY4201560.1 phage portal protein [Schaedlerella sp.]
MKPFWKKEEKTNIESDRASQSSCIKMITTYGENYYAWDGKLYESDIVRACIRPKVKAIGKLTGKHIRDDPKNGLKVNTDANIRFLLSEPNPYMTGQQMQEKVANQLALNNNAFILIVRDENDKPLQIYPVPCVMAEAKYNDYGELFIKFQYRNGKSGTFRYRDIIHLRQDYNDNDIFGDSPAPAIASMMNVICTIDQGIIKAIKNSSIVRWLLTFNSSMRDEDIKKNVQKFVDNYLSVETDTFGAAGVDAKASIQRIEPKDYVPNATQTEKTIDRIYSFFNTNKKIVQSDYTENEWTAYYEAEVEPVVVQMHQTYTVGLFTRKERGFGNKIVFEANNLQCATLTTKLQFQAMVDRGAMTPNEWRETMNLAPLEGGDEPIRRLDTQVVNLVKEMLNKINSENYAIMADLITKTLAGVTGGGGDVGENRY